MQKLAILLATYNGQAYLQPMLESLEAQTYGGFTCYIHDDGSTDGTCELLRGWVQAHPERYELIGQEAVPTGSAKANFMWMLGQVEADYYMFADQDDVWMPEKVACSVQRLEELESKLSLAKAAPVLTFSDMQVVDESLTPVAPSFISYIGRDPQALHLGRLLIDNPAAGCTMAFNRALRDLALQLADISQITMHDQWMMTLAAAYKDGHIAYIAEPQVLYRQHAANVMGAVAESKVAKLKRNLSDVFSGRTKREKAAFIQEARSLAAQLALVEGLPEESRQFAGELAAIASQPKLKRISFYRRHGLNRASGTAWMYLWI